jgi:hypothetical protein
VIGPNGQPVEWQERLRVGQRIDRYGSEFGGREPHPRRARVRERAVAARQRLSGARRLTFAGRRTGLTEAEKGRGPAHTVPAPTSHGRLRSAVGRLPRQSSP